MAATAPSEVCPKAPADDPSEVAIDFMPLHSIHQQWIDEQGGGSQPALNICSHCGAAVLVGMLGVHAEWHRRVEG